MSVKQLCMYNDKSQWNSILLLMNMLDKELKQHI